MLNILREGCMHRWMGKRHVIRAGLLIAKQRSRSRNRRSDEQHGRDSRVPTENRNPVNEDDVEEKK
jgi:hypothetical protein